MLLEENQTAGSNNEGLQLRILPALDKVKKARINSVHIRHKIGGGEFSWWPLFISRDTVRSALNKGSVVGAPYLSLTFSGREEFSSGFALRGAPFCDSQFVELNAPRS